MSTAPGGATVTAGATKSTYTDTGNFIVDMIPTIQSLDPRDAPFLDLIGIDGLIKDCTSTTHQWLNDELIPYSAALTGDHTADDNTLTVGTTSNDYFKVDDIVLCNDIHYRVTVVGASALTTTAVTTTDAAAVTGDIVYNLGPARLDGATFAVTGDFTSLWTENNYTQIFSDTISVTGSQQAVEKYGVSSEVDYQLEKKMKELRIKFEWACVYQLKSATFPTSNAQPGRRLGGLYTYIRNDSNANRLDASTHSLGNVLKPEHIDTVMQDIYTDGGHPTHLLVGAYQKRTVDSWGEPFIRTVRTEDTWGRIITNYQSSMGNLEVLLTRHIKPNDAIIIDKNLIGIGPLADRSFKAEKMPRVADSEQWNILGEYTMEVRCANRGHGWIYKLSSS